MRRNRTRGRRWLVGLAALSYGVVVRGRRLLRTAALGSVALSLYPLRSRAPRRNLPAVNALRQKGKRGRVNLFSAIFPRAREARHQPRRPPLPFCEIPFCEIAVGGERWRGWTSSDRRERCCGRRRGAPKPTRGRRWLVGLAALSYGAVVR